MSKNLLGIFLLAALPLVQAQELDPAHVEPPPLETGGRQLRLGGWLDLAFLASEDDSEFVLPHVYLFLDADLSTSWSGFLEVSHKDTPIASEETSLERAFVEYHHGIPTRIRVGRFNTPAGLWKQSQWSIMLDSNSKPLIEAQHWIPQLSSGIEFLGKKVSSGLEWNYDLFISRQESEDKPIEYADTRTSFGGDLSVMIGERIHAGVFYHSYRNDMEGIDPVPGDRRSRLVYTDVQILPGLSWRAEYLDVQRGNQPDLDGFYTRLKWRFQPDLFANYRYDQADMLKGMLAHRHKVHTATLGYWPLPWLRTRAEIKRHRVEGLQQISYNEGSLWMGVLF